MKKTLLLSSILLALLSANASAGIYKWVDYNGRTHYAKVLPADESNIASKESVTILNDSIVSKKVISKETESQKEKTNKLVKETKEEKERHAELEKSNKFNCDKSQENLRVLENGGRITKDENVENRNGKEFLSDSEIKNSLVQAKKDVEYWCVEKEEQISEKKK